MLPKPARPRSRAGSARMTRPLAVCRPQVRPRPSSAPTATAAGATHGRREVPEQHAGGLRIDGKSIRRSTCSPRVLGGKLLHGSGGGAASKTGTAGRRRIQIVSRPLRAFNTTDDFNQMYLLSNQDHDRHHHFIHSDQYIHRFNSLKHGPLQASDESEDNSIITNGTGNPLLKFCENEIGCVADDRLTFIEEDNIGPSVPQLYADETNIQKMNLTEVSEVTSTHNFETSSTEGSEESLLSLGSKIRMIAVCQRQHKQRYRYSNKKNEQETNDENKINSKFRIKDNRLLQDCTKSVLEVSEDNEFHFNSADWRQLLQQNNELLSKLSKTRGAFFNRCDNVSDTETTLSSHSTEKSLYKNEQEINYEEKLRPAENTEDVPGITENEFQAQRTGTPSQAVEKYLFQSNKPIRPLTPITPDCILEDINEESSDAEVDSLPSDYKSAIEDNVIVSNEQKFSANKYDDEIKKTECVGNQSCAQNKYNLFQNEASKAEDVFDQPSQGSCSGYKSLFECFPLQNSLLEALNDIPSRNDFIFQKNNITRLIQQKALKRREVQNTQKIDACTLDTLDESDEQSKSIAGKDCTSETNSIVADEPTNPTDKRSAGAIRAEHPEPPSLSQNLICLEKLSKTVAFMWGTASAEGPSEEDKKQVVTAATCLLQVCLQAGWLPQSADWPDLHRECGQKLAKLQEDFHVRTQKNLELMRKLLDDKQRLTDEAEQHTKKVAAAEMRTEAKIKQLQSRHTLDLHDVKQRLLAAEQSKRENWMANKTKAIKECSFRGLETRIKDLTARHRDEISALKAQHWQAVRDVEERTMQQLRQQEQQLKIKAEAEIEEAIRRERDREAQRLELELRHSAQVARDAAHSASTAHEAVLREQRENYDRALQQSRDEHERAMQQATRASELAKLDLTAKMAALAREHEMELCRLAEEREASDKRLREELTRQAALHATVQERHLTDKLKRQRDRDIERAVREMQQQAESDLQQRQQESEQKYKALESRCAAEVSAAQRAEQLLRSRLLDARSAAAQLEEEAVCLRGRLLQQHRELHRLQQMVDDTAHEGPYD